MRVKLYSKIIKNETQIFDPVSKQVKELSPEAKPEELLGEFSVSEFIAPNGSKWIVVATPRGDIKIDAETLTKATRVNVFRVEII